MFMDPPMKILTKNDGIVSLMHCQEGNFIYIINMLHTICYNVYLKFVFYLNSIKSGNVKCITHVLHTHSNKHY